VRAFSCPYCGNLVFFENTTCLRCGAALGFDPELGAVVPMREIHRPCANRAVAGCNWLLGPGETLSLCRSCRLTRTRPNDADTHAIGHFAQAEAAKRRLIFQLLDLGLPVGDQSPIFDLLAGQGDPVLTGHLDGVITINLAESDDRHREWQRERLGEPYRTMLGHFRHEIGHHCWPILNPTPSSLEECRARFGDERGDYQSALERYYRDGPPMPFVDRYVSAYATAHPWEDWAETFAHYLHIRDTLQTAAAYGMVVTGPVTVPPLAGLPALMAAPAVVDPRKFEDILAQWLPLTYALNAVNRSMGKDDLYPFVLASAVIDKLGLVHERVIQAGSRPLNSTTC